MDVKGGEEMKISIEVANDVKNDNSYFIRWIRKTIMLLNNASLISPNKDIQIQISGKYEAPETLNIISPALIKLAIKNTNYWAQIVFQFSHEYCHYLVNSPLLPQANDEWFEEVICECASRYVLLNLNDDVEAQKYFKGSFKKYALSRNDPDKEKIFKLNLLDEDSQLLKNLRAEHYSKHSRKYFNHISNIIMPIILENNSFWQSIPGIALFNDDNTFIENLNAWYQESPKSSKPQVAKIIKLFK